MNRDLYFQFKKRNLTLKPLLDFHKTINVVICGINRLAAQCFEEMHQCRINVLAFVDIHPSQKEYLNRPVMSIEEAAARLHKVDLAIFAGSETLTPESNAYISSLAILQQLHENFHVPAYHFTQMLIQCIVFDSNLKLFGQERLRRIPKFVFMHYTLGSLPRIQESDKPICAIYKVPDMRNNPDCYSDIYQDIQEYSDEYIKDVMYSPGFINDDRGVPVRMEDRRTPYVNIVEGKRLTTDVPEVYHHTVHIIGPCMALGFGTDDSRTIASVLQRKLNASFPGWRVVNHSLIDHLRLEIYFPYILSRINFKDGDILLYFSYNNYFSYQPITDAYARRKTESAGAHYISMYKPLSAASLKDRMFVSSRHLSYKGMELYANTMYTTIFDYLQKAQNLPPQERATHTIPADTKQIPVNIATYSNNPDLQQWLLTAGKERFPSDLYIGAAVMNCNPFTLGHRYLIEKALQYVNGLYIFVVEEDASYFSFKDRIELVRSSVKDLPNVKVIPSGKFILSAKTFGEYFNKESPEGNLTTIDASTDVHIFGKYIAPLMNIKIRFVGEEPLCQVTRQYNAAMLDILPQYGIDVQIIQRLTMDGMPISASQIRKYIKELTNSNNTEAKESAEVREIYAQLQKRLPASTLSYICKKFSLDKL